MIISRRKNFLFFHLPKVAGSSITSVLRKYGHIPSERLYNYMYDYLGPRNSIWLFPRHIKPIEARRVLPKDLFNNFFKFAFVRNPYDWHVSQYNYHKNAENAIFHKEIRGLSFEEYVEWALDHVSEANSIQSDFLSDFNGNLLVDFVGKYENLSADFAGICEQLKIENKLPRKNPSKRIRDFDSYYTDRLRKLIYESHIKDFQNFGYDF